jgi:hypothetical protein
MMDITDSGLPSAQSSAANRGIDAETESATPPHVAQVAPVAIERSMVITWLVHDIPYIAMLLLALVGVVFRLPVFYWIMLFPVFAVISVLEARNRFATRGEHVIFVAGIALNWVALLLATYLLYSGGVQGVMNANASSLAMMILLALGTFCAGLQARIWQICAVGGVLFLAVPALGWLDQSPLLLTVSMVVVIALGGAGWWVTSRTV